MFKIATMVSLSFIFWAGSLFIPPDAIAQSTKDEALELRKKLLASYLETVSISVLLSSKTVIYELDATENQVQALTQLAKTSPGTDKKFYQLVFSPRASPKRESSDLPKSDYTAAIEINKKGLEILRQWNAKLDEILLPHQNKRLRQLMEQQNALTNNQYGSEVGLVYGMAEKLGLDPEEKQKLSEMTKKSKEEYFRKVEALQAKFYEKIVAELSPGLRDKYMELVGERFDFEKENRKIREQVSNESKK